MIRQQLRSRRRLRWSDMDDDEVEAEAEAGSGGHHYHSLEPRKRARPQLQSMTETTSQVASGSGAKGSPKRTLFLEEGSSKEYGETRLHPLLIPLVLKRVFELCEPPRVADLKNYRLVCRAWEEASSDEWRKHAVLTLLPEVTHSGNPKNGIFVRDFAEVMTSKTKKYRKLQLKPFRNFRMSRMDYYQRSTRPTNKFYRVWKDLLGPSTSFLEISNCRLELPDVVKLIGGAVNLEKLVTTGNIITYDLRQEFPELEGVHHPKSITVGDRDVEAIGLVPTVEEIIFDSNRRYMASDSTLCDLRTALRVGRDERAEWDDDDEEEEDERIVLKNLKRLDVLSDPFFSDCDLNYEQVLYSISRLQLPPLEYLAVRLHTMSWSNSSCNDHLKALVTSFRGSLRTFKVLWDPVLERNCGPSDNFPYGLHMLEMKELYLWGDVTTNLHFLKFTPDLEVLHISALCFDVFTKDFDSSLYPEEPDDRFSRTFQMDLVQKVDELGFDMTGVSMRSLTHLYIDCPLSVDSIGTLGVWMPHLKSLKIYVESGAQLRKVCETWPELEELVLLRESFIQDEDVSEGLVNLKRLKRFGFDFLCSCNPTSLTESAIRNGFLKMESLRSVTIPVHPEMDPEAELAVEAKCYLAPVNVIRNRDSCHHQLFKSWIRADLDPRK